MLIDNMSFYYTIEQLRDIYGVTICENNYKYSNIRAWLNGYNGHAYNVDNYTNIGFYDVAFNETKKI